MLMILGDVALLFAVLVFGAGMVLLHKAVKEKTKYLKVAGYVLTIFSIVAFVCIGFHSIKMHRSVESMRGGSGMLGMGPARGQMMLHGMRQCLYSMKGRALDEKVIDEIGRCGMRGMVPMDPPDMDGN